MPDKSCIFPTLKAVLVRQEQINGTNPDKVASFDLHGVRTGHLASHNQEDNISGYKIYQ
jgi:hypothetical protein